jgi:predicted dehydrogenase
VELKALIIGTGSIGRRHMHNLAKIVPGIGFILLRRQDAPALVGPHAATTVHGMDEALSGMPDIAVLSTPSAMHHAPLQSLLGAGVPTYVEKPVVTTRAHVEAIRGLLSTSPSAGHAAGYNLRLLPSLIRARQIVAEGQLGSIVRASFTAGQWLPDWRKGQDHRQGYSARPAEGGGVIFDLSHELDSARHLLGEIDLLSVLTSRVDELDIASEGVAAMLGRTGSGALVSFNIDYVARRPIRRYELVGTRATLVWDLQTRRLILSREEGEIEIDSGPYGFDVSQTYVTAMRAFAASQRDFRLQDIEDGLRSSELAVAAHELSGWI